MNFFFTSDTHFGHSKIIEYCDRPFTSVEEMDETLIQNWNNVIGVDDVVYHLGDFSFVKPLKYLERLNGYINIIPGSHDKKFKKNLSFDSIPKSLILPSIAEIKVNIDGINQLIVMCHYSMRSWNKSHYGTWHFYGHHHGKLPPHGLSFDVGVDTNDYYPYSLEDVVNKMKTLSREFVIKEILK